jgi:ketosteroid isomerase-like protein
MVFTITDGLDRGERAKRRFYKTLVRLLQEGPGVQPADVFVMMTVMPPENFSFADGVTGTDVAAAEALDTAAKAPSSRETYTKAEMAYAITELLWHRDSSRILPMLRQDFVLKIPATLPYGGEFTGPEAFAKFFAGTPGGAEVWESFDVHVDQVIESADYLVAQLTNRAVLKATGNTVVFQNVWLFEVAGGRLVASAFAQLRVGGPFADAGQGPADGLGAVRGDARADQRVHDLQLGRPEPGHHRGEVAGRGVFLPGLAGGPVEQHDYGLYWLDAAPSGIGVAELQPPGPGKLL